MAITSLSTSSYSFSLSIFWHWHSFTHNRSTKPLLPSQKPSKTGSVNYIFGNIEIKKEFLKITCKLQTNYYLINYWCSNIIPKHSHQVFLLSLQSTWLSYRFYSKETHAAWPTFYFQTKNNSWRHTQATNVSILNQGNRVLFKIILYWTYL